MNNQNQNRVTVNETVVSGKVFQAFVESNMGMNPDTSDFSDLEKSQLNEMIASSSF